jgi:hypothetical protein
VIVRICDHLRLTKVNLRYPRPSRLSLSFICGSVAAQAHDRRTKMRLCGIPELRDQRMGAQVTLDGRALDALAATVDQPHDVEACGVSGVEIVVDNGEDVPRREGMQIDRVLDGYRDRLFISHSGSCRLRRRQPVA